MTTNTDTQAHGGGVEWPERLTLRDTKVIADEGQRIFSTATGYGYEKREYVRADLAPGRAEIDRLKEALHDLLTRPTDGAARVRARAALAASPAAPAPAAGVDQVREAVKSAIITCHDKGYGVAMSANAAEVFVNALLTTWLASPAPDAKGER